MKRVVRVRRPRRRPSAWGTGLGLGFLGFFIAVAVGLPSETLVARLPVYLSVPIVLLIVAVAIVLDMLGVAVTAADPVPFHARSSNRESGARQALWLVARADRVASLAMDITGDVTAAVAGAAVVSILAGLADDLGLPRPLMNALGIGLVTFLFIGGKAGVKAYSIRHANAIVHVAGVALEWIERAVRVEFTRNRSRRPNRRGRERPPGEGRRTGAP
ncbi:MAG: hypothetical protein IRZ11_03995 [Clostridia bacterium]|nr:hypothetical protein [Clostridia bacterium]